MSSQSPESFAPDHSFTREEAAAIRAAMEDRLESLARVVQLRDENTRLWNHTRELETRRTEILRPVREANAAREARRERIRDVLRLAAWIGVVAVAGTTSIFVARSAFGGPAVALISVGFVAVCCLVSARPKESTGSKGGSR